MYTLTYESVATKKIKGAEMEELLEKARENFIKALGENQFDFTEFLR